MLELDFERHEGGVEVSSPVNSRAREVSVISPIDWAERNLTVAGKPLNLHWRPWWHLPYNANYMKNSEGQYYRMSVLCCGRGTEKSTNLGNMALVEVQVPWTNVIYIAPSREQLSEFSFHRIDEIVETSPLLAAQACKDKWSVGRKVFQNHARITLRSAYLTAARARGVHGHALFLDEAQDILIENIPIIRECLAHCDRPAGPIFRMLGTPLTFDNPVEYYLSEHSNKMEWCIRCSSCGKWADGVYEENIGARGLICRNCSGLLNPFGDVVDGKREGALWAVTGRESAPMLGFRIPQLLLPYTFAYNGELFQQQWRSILFKRRTYRRYQFYNEILGISYDSGDKPITYGDLRACCVPGRKLINLSTADKSTLLKCQSGYVFCGVDWGSGDPSKTVFTAARYVADVYEVFYMKKFEGHEAEPDFVRVEVLRLLKLLKAAYVGLDWGFGFALNSDIRAGFGLEKTMVYAHTTQREKLSYDSGARAFTTNRTAVLSDIFQLIKRGPVPGGIRFDVDWSEFRDREFAKDFLSVHKEASRLHGGERMQYRHAPGTTDDTLHAVCFGFLASQIKFPRRDLSS